MNLEDIAFYLSDKTDENKRFYLEQLVKSKAVIIDYFQHTKYNHNYNMRDILYVLDTEFDKLARLNF